MRNTRIRVTNVGEAGETGVDNSYPSVAIGRSGGIIFIQPESAPAFIQHGSTRPTRHAFLDMRQTSNAAMGELV